MTPVADAFREALVREVVSDRLSVPPYPTEKDIAVLKKALEEYGLSPKKVSEIFTEELRAAQARQLSRPMRSVDASHPHRSGK